jgi:hypothetical protein
MALFPKAILSFISSSTVLSVFTDDPRYLNDLTCSISLFSIFMAGTNLLLRISSYLVESSMGMATSQNMHEPDKVQNMHIYTRTLA